MRNKNKIYDIGQGVLYVRIPDLIRCVVVDREEEDGEVLYKLMALAPKEVFSLVSQDDIEDNISGALNKFTTGLSEFVNSKTMDALYYCQVFDASIKKYKVTKSNGLSAPYILEQEPRQIGNLMRKEIIA